MTSARSPATPDLMALLCLMGGAVRGAGELQLLMQLLTIGSLVPSFGLVLRAWISAEERAGCNALQSGVWFAEVEAEEGEELPGDDIGPLWTREKGRVLLWEHVTRFGTVMLIPMEGPWLTRVEPLASPCASWRAVWRILAAVFSKFLLGGLGAGTNCVQNVAIS